MELRDRFTREGAIAVKNKDQTLIKPFPVRREKPGERCVTGLELPTTQRFRNANRARTGDPDDAYSTSARWRCDSGNGVFIAARRIRRCFS